MMHSQVTFRPLEVSGYRTGALDISVQQRRVISLPSQLGCRVGCQFCVSKETPLVRNLTVSELLQMVAACFDAAPPDGRPVELSFTGEGEPLLNWKNTAACIDEAAGLYPDAVRAVRYSFSGIGADQLLRSVRIGVLPVRLQLSLHAARQAVRNRLIPRSEPLSVIEAALRRNAWRFSAIELNVVLQDGVNDQDADLAALATWGDARWPVLLSPLLTNGREVVARRTDEFAAALRDAGRHVKVYSAVGAHISRQGIYPLLSAQTLTNTRKHHTDATITPRALVG